MTEVLPMFPLGSVLFPHAVLPLHVFEPRYLALVERCLAGDQQFGVVLIERGSEVGGGDVRFAVGTVARIVQAGRLDDGRWVLVTVGTQRLRVERWLPDDPYPLAEVERLDDELSGALDTQRVSEVAALLRRVHGLRAELGEPGGMVDVELDADLPRASFEAAALAPLGPLDAQRLLELDDTDTRLATLEALLGEEATILELRLSSDT
jgi:Lon protease-like protein